METNLCPTCHAPIPANAPGGFCPVCLLRDAEEPPIHGDSAPSLQDIAAAFPQWEIIELIGRGGMGFVYKVRQPNLDRIVALKILSPELGRDPAFAERFAREARTLGKLQHPNIVTVFEHGEKDGLFYLLMEYVDGVNLRQAMRAGRFTPEQALAIVPGICDALQAAHAQGIWHRDIKPENILLDRDGGVKIADFGIARIVGDPQRDFTLTRTGNALGSVSYMAPEQHEKPHDVDHRADIYSLGVVIYEMLTGELPLGRFPAPSQRAAVDARIDEIVFKTLEKERELRQQSVTEVKTDVHRALRPGESTRFVNPETPHGSSSLAKLACGLLIGGALGFPLLAGIGMRTDFAATFGVICVLLACVLGVVTWRERLGKFVVLASGCLLVLCVLFVTWNTPSLRVRREPPTTTITDSPAAKFDFTHPDSFTGVTGIRIPIPDFPISLKERWFPEDGQRITLKDGKNILVRVRVARNRDGTLDALAASSDDGKQWETQGVSLEATTPTKQAVFKNGTKVTIRFLTPSADGMTEPAQNRDSTSAPPLPSPPPVTAVPVPTVSPEEVFRKANAAANESNGDVFKSLVWENSTLIGDTVAGSGEDVRAFTLDKMEELEFMALFAGEITYLKVVSVASGRVPKRHTFGPEGKFTPVAYAAIRKGDGSLTRLGVSFRNKNGQWIGTEVWFPNYGTFSRIEFKPENGDASTILKTHLDSDVAFRAVEGKPGMYDVFGFDSDADVARLKSIGRVQELCRSLDQFDLGKYLKIISPAEKPGHPYMGENEPPYVPEKP